MIMMIKMNKIMIDKKLEKIKIKILVKKIKQIMIKIK
jgi:hypothetical protein